jgi:hypothetical protein
MCHGISVQTVDTPRLGNDSELLSNACEIRSSGANAGADEGACRWCRSAGNLRQFKTSLRAAASLRYGSGDFFLDSGDFQFEGAQCTAPVLASEST